MQHCRMRHFFILFLGLMGTAGAKTPKDSFMTMALPV
jgi:hypothetical protein